MGPSKNIMTVSLESAKRAKAYAVYDGKRVFITHCTPISGHVSAWEKDLLEEIQDKVKKGFVVLVEDRTGVFSFHATPFSFEEVDDGRTMLYHSLDWWCSMQGIGGIILDPEVERNNIRVGGEGSMIDRQQDEKGRITYNINWQAFHGGHKAVLMCIAGAMMEPLSERYLNAMFGEQDAAMLGEFDPNLTFAALICHDAEQFRAIDAAGKKK